MSLEKDVLTTKEAADLLRLSITSVQKMVINGELEAWTTPGGHRRIYRASVEALAQQRPGASNPANSSATLGNSAPSVAGAIGGGFGGVSGPATATAIATAVPSAGRTLRALLAEDDPDQVAYMSELLQGTRLPIELVVAHDASQALVLIERQRPDLVITDLVMQPFDGFHLVKMLDNDPAYRSIDVLVTTSLNVAEIRASRRLPDWVTIYQKPVGIERLLGYIDALQGRTLRGPGTP
ncbi:response regulator [Roseateles amylovorans]|uniref:Response regulator n=1 Tax=Roseateles amylovorans TaxID=2978473 RepID=A0ABY6AYE6_9BURK|nr:response regulator [Roseateles amylovorans]UXH76774.1 response regulator [Roseateles amylovorans]